MKRPLTSCFGLGHLPIAPGTWGSIPPAVVFAAAAYLCSISCTVAAMAVFAVAGSVACVALAPAAIKATGKKDPGEVVADEFAGQALAFLVAVLLGAPLATTKELLAITALGFFIFRLFDIIKPFPARALEKLPDGWGILADDLMAGLYAGIATFALSKLWLLYATVPD